MDEEVSKHTPLISDPSSYNYNALETFHNGGNMNNKVSQNIMLSPKVKFKTFDNMIENVHNNHNKRLNNNRQSVHQI